MPWLSPTYEHLRAVAGAARTRLLLCSPFVGAPALQAVSDALDNPPKEVEVWTRLSLRDWIGGASDVLALAQFIDQHQSRSVIRIRHSDHLHAKLVVADERKALVGSANLTRGGFARNIEASVLLLEQETLTIQPHITWMRDRLTSISGQRFFEFVRQCEETEKTREAIVDLIRHWQVSLRGIRTR